MNSLGPVLVVVLFAIAILSVHLLRRMFRGGPLIETGLKAIDLFVPIPVGGDVLISGDAQTGTRVLGIELAYRLMNHPRHKFHVVLYLDQTMADVESWVLELQESLPSFSNRFVVPAISTTEIQQQLSVAGRGPGVAIFAVSRSERFLYSFHEAIRTARETATTTAPITSFSLTEEFVPPGYDVTIFCSRTLAQEGIYPALNPQISNSVASSHPAIGEKRRQVAESARTAITEVLQHLYPEAMANPDWGFNRDATKRTAVQATRFMSQPFFVAEPFTGKAGANVPIRKTIADFESILNGKHRDVPPQQLMYLNELSVSRR